MKKLICSLAILLGVGGSYQANAQATLNVGVKADANVSNYIHSKIPHTDSKMRVGADLGLFFNIEFGSGAFALQPELMFNYQGSKLKQKAYGTIPTSTSKLDYWGFEVPVYAVGQLQGNNGGKWYLGIGPYIGCGFSLENKTTDRSLYKNDAMKRFDFGGAAMVGYQFPFGMQINAGYKLSILDQVDKGAGHMRSQVVSFGLGYVF